MNLLQSFMAECNRQTRAINQEAATIGSDTYYGTFGDASMLPDMIRTGYEDAISAVFIASADQFTTPPEPRQIIKRSINNAEYLIQLVDRKNPVVYTFILVDREP